MNKKIVVADDDKAVLMAARLYLEGKGYEVVTVEDGEKAIAAVESEKPGVVVLDVKMPEKNGFEVCKEIKENEKTKDTIVIIFSGMIEEIEKGFDYGADDCLTKPLNWNILIERIERLSAIQE